MSVIVPTVLTDNVQEYQALMQLYATFTSRIQIDITDASFAPNATVTLEQIGWPSNIDVDLHMMVRRPSAYLELIIERRPSLVIFHAESDEDLLPSFAELKTAGIRSGVAFLGPTFPGNYRPYLDAAEHALIFAGKLGENGGTANMLQAEKVHMIKNLNTKLEVGWDGGARMDNVFMLTKAGVNVISVGGALRTEDPAATFKALGKEANREGAI